MEFEYHNDLFFITPSVGISEGSCGPDCDHVHLRLSIGWLLWSLHIQLS